jgi:hypothetical protein
VAALFPGKKVQLRSPKGYRPPQGSKPETPRGSGAQVNFKSAVIEHQITISTKKNHSSRLFTQPATTIEIDRPGTGLKLEFIRPVSLKVFRTIFIIADECLRGNNIGHHFLIQRIHDSAVESFGYCQNHKRLV